MAKKPKGERTSAAEKTPVQNVLIPTERPTAMTTMDIALESLPPDDPAMLPTPGMIQSVQNFGVMAPIVVSQKEGEEQLRVVDGKRRIAAARAVGLKEIAASIYFLSDDSEAAALIMLNDQRKGNPIAEFGALERLVKDNVPDEQIAGAIGIPVTSVRKRKVLFNLTPRLMNLWRTGKMKTGVAFDIAKMSKEMIAQIDQFAGEMTKGSNLSAKAVEALKRVQQQKDAPTLFEVDKDDSAGQADNLAAILKVKHPKLALSDAIWGMIARDAFVAARQLLSETTEKIVDGDGDETDAEPVEEVEESTSAEAPAEAPSVGGAEALTMENAEKGLIIECTDADSPIFGHKRIIENSVKGENGGIVVKVYPVDPKRAPQMIKASALENWKISSE